MSGETSFRARLIRWAPALVGVACALLGLGALGLASQGLRFTVAPVEEPKTEADPLALLEDHVGALQTELGRLSGELGQNLESLGRSLDEAGAARAGALEARLTALDKRLARLVEEQRALAAAVAAVGSSGASGAPVAQEPVAQAPPPEEPAPEATPSAPKRGLFTYKGDTGVDFAERLRFQVLGSLSRVGFDAKSTLHDFSGVTSDVEGWLEAKLADPSDGKAEIKARAATLLTGIEGRDEELRKRLDTARHPDIAFAMSGFRAAQVDAGKRTLSGEVLGQLTIKGVARPVVVPVKVEVDAARRLVLTGEVRLKMSDHGVEPPDVGPISVEDEVRVWLALRLRSLGKAGS